MGQIYIKGVIGLKISRLAIFVLALVLLVSCTGKDSAGETDKGPHSTAERIVPSDYHTGDIDYTLKISDGKRTVSLSVTRRGEVTDGKIVSPEALSGVSVISDAGGVRIITPSGEALGLTEESAAGLRAFFDVMGRRVTDSEKKTEGMYNFELSGFEVTLLLNSEGMPRLITLTKNGYTRHGEVAFGENDGQNPPGQ